jgi:hypothetical protein
VFAQEKQFVPIFLSRVAANPQSRRTGLEGGVKLLGAVSAYKKIRETLARRGVTAEAQAAVRRSAAANAVSRVFRTSCAG